MFLRSTSFSGSSMTPSSCLGILMSGFGPSGTSNGSFTPVKPWRPPLMRCRSRSSRILSFATESLILRFASPAYCAVRSLSAASISHRKSHRGRDPSDGRRRACPRSGLCEIKKRERTIA